MTGSAVWRFENGRIHEAEVEGLKTGLKQVEERIAAGEFVKPEREPKTKAPTRADLEARLDQVFHLVQTAREARGVRTIHDVLDKALDVLKS